MLTTYSTLRYFLSFSARFGSFPCSSSWAIFGVQFYRSPARFASVILHVDKQKKGEILTDPFIYILISILYFTIEVIKVLAQSRARINAFDILMFSKILYIKCHVQYMQLLTETQSSLTLLSHHIVVSQVCSNSHNLCCSVQVLLVPYYLFKKIVKKRWNERLWLESRANLERLDSQLFR